MKDTTIIELFFARNQTAIRETDLKYGHYLSCIASNILRSPEDAEEVVSDTYWKAWDTIPPERPAVLKHFLSRITRNLAINRLKYLSAKCRGAETVELLEELSECIGNSANDPQNALDEKELARILNEFLDSLPAIGRALFLSRYYDSCTIREVSLRYDVPERRVKYLLSTYRTKLKQILQKEGVAL